MSYRHLPGSDAKESIGSTTKRWKTLHTSAPIANGGASIITAQVDRASSTTLTAITGLSCALEAGYKYILEAYVPGVATTNGGAKFAFGTSDTLTATSFNATGRQMNGTTINANDTTTTFGAAIGNAKTVFTHAVLRGAIVVNAAGTLTVQIGQNTSHADTTSAYVNGYLKVTRVA